MPTGFLMRDPRNLKKKDLQNFLEHIQSRQRTQSANEVFRFGHFERRSQLHKALYSDEEERPLAAVTPRNTRPARQKSKRNTGKHDKDHEDSQSRSTAAVHTSDTTGHELADIASSESGSAAEQSTIIIDQSQMSRLISHGYPTSIPINGPNEGPPQYQVPVEALGLLSVLTPKLPGSDLDLPGGSNTIAVDPDLQ